MWAALGVASLFGCQSGEVQDAPSAATVQSASSVSRSAAPQIINTPASKAPSTAPSSTAPSSAAPSSAAVDLLACKEVSDCVVVPSIRGHAKRIPDPSVDECASYCYAAVNRKYEATWREAVRTVGPKIRCNKKFAKCPGAEQHHALCLRGHCQAEWRAPQR